MKHQLYKAKREQYYFSKLTEPCQGCRVDKGAPAGHLFSYCFCAMILLCTFVFRYYFCSWKSQGNNSINIYFLFMFNPHLYFISWSNVTSWSLLYYEEGAIRHQLLYTVKSLVFLICLSVWTRYTKTRNPKKNVPRLF